MFFAGDARENAGHLNYLFASSYFVNIALLFILAPLPPDPLPHQGKVEAVLIKRKRDNQRFMLNRTPPPSHFGERSGVG